MYKLEYSVESSSLEFGTDLDRIRVLTQVTMFFLLIQSPRTVSDLASFSFLKPRV